MIPVQGFNTEVFSDERGAFEKLNRMSLYYLLWANGVENVSDSMPKDMLIKFAEINRENLLMQGPSGSVGYKNVVAYQDVNGGIVIQRPKEHMGIYTDLSGHELDQAIKTKPKAKSKKVE